MEAALDADVAAQPADSALEYIDRSRAARAQPDRIRRRSHPNPVLGSGSAPAESGPAPPSKAQLDTRTRWERVPLGESVELHIRVPLGKRKHQQIERLIRLGKELLEEGD